jgi:hypothetical protein
MSNDHPFDRSVDRTELRVVWKQWPDSYWEVDVLVMLPGERHSTTCIPLFSGTERIRPQQVQTIKHICALAVESMTGLDLEPGPF